MLRYDVFLAGDDNLDDIAEAANGRIRMDGMSHEDVVSITKMAEKFGLTVLAFISTDEE